MKKLVLTAVMGLAIIVSTGAVSVSASAPIEAQVQEEINEINSDTPSVYADIIEYRYALVDGYVYRRLYNLSRNCWVEDSEWEFVI